MTPRRANPARAVAAVVELAARRPAHTVWVGIDGCGAAGKSTLAARVAAAVPGALVVAVDDFAGPHVPEWDYDRFNVQVARPLRAGRPTRYQRWEWNRDVGAEWHDLVPGRVLVIEGVSATRAEVEVPWDLQLWVDAPRDLRLARAGARDGADQLWYWTDVWMPSEQAYIAREQPQQRVDVIVDGSGPDMDTPWVLPAADSGTLERP